MEADEAAVWVVECQGGWVAECPAVWEAAAEWVAVPAVGRLGAAIRARN